MAEFVFQTIDLLMLFKNYLIGLRLLTILWTIYVSLVYFSYD